MRLTIVLLSLLASGCATAGGKAFRDCELGQLPAIEEAAIAEVSSIISTGTSDWESQLMNVGISIGPGQLDCILKAIVAAWTAPKAALRAERLQAVERAQKFLIKTRPTSMRPVRGSMATTHSIANLDICKPCKLNRCGPAYARACGIK